MPSLIKIKIERGRDLPAVDKNTISAEQSTDAYVEIKLDEQVQKTSTCRKSDNPVWNEEFRFEVIDDSILQDAPIELKCFDHDIYSSEVLGVVYIDLNPLIMRTTHGSDRDLIISGWFPLFDTVKGVRGSLLVTVKLQFLGNENPFGDSSAGVQFFSSSQLSPKCFIIQEIIGFVEDLVVEDNPENTWQDYFRKASKVLNDSRLKVLYNLSAEVRRELGKKVLEAGGNAVLAYSVQFDTEGSSGIVARAFGTACKLLKVDSAVNSVMLPLQHVENIIPQLAVAWRSIVDGTGCMALIQRDTAELLSNRLARELNLSSSVAGSGGASSTTNKSEALVWVQADENRMVHFLQLLPFGACRDTKTGTRDHAGSSGPFPVGGKADFTGLDWSAAGVTVDNTNIFQSEVQLLSMRTFPDNVRIKIGGLVLARSVKFLGKLEASVSDQETREGWWTELRDEIKSHAKVLCCRHIIGYSENCTIVGDVCILTAIGTAAVLKGLAHPTGYLTHQSMTGNNTSTNEMATTTGSLQTLPSGSNSGSAAKNATSPVPRTGRSSSVLSRTGQLDGIAVSNPVDERSSSVDSVEAEYTNPLTLVPAGVSAVPPVGRSSSNQSFLAPSEGVLLATQGSSANASSTPTPTSAMIRSQSAQEVSARIGSGRKLWNTTDDALQGFDPITMSTPLSNKTYGQMVPAGAGLRLKKPRRPCVAVHVPYNHRTAPFSFMRLVPCASCRRKWVPETLLASTEPPASLQVKGCGQMLEARVCRSRRGATGEADAVKISEVLPFVEYDLQRQVILKLKILGMNAAFGYSCKIQIGNDLVIATATCTAMWLESLPSPPPVQIVRSRDARSQQELRLASLQRQLEDLMLLNKETLDKQYSYNKMIVRRRQHAKMTPGNRSSPLKDVTQLANFSSSGGSGMLAIEGGQCIHVIHEERSQESVDGSLDSSSASASSESTSSSSSSSSSSEDTSDGDDSSSLESPPSSSSSSSSGEDEGEQGEEDGDGQGEAEGEQEGSGFEEADEEDEDIGGSSMRASNVDDTSSALSTGGRSPRPAVQPGVGATESQQRVSVKEWSTRSSRHPSAAVPVAPTPIQGVDISSTRETRERKATLTETVKRKRRMVYKDDRAPFLMEVDDETDSDILAVLTDWTQPVGFEIVNTLFVPGSVDLPTGTGRNVSVLRRGRVLAAKSTVGTLQVSAPSSAALNSTLSKLFLEAYMRLCFSVKDMMPCQVLGMSHHVNIIEDGMIEILLNAMVHKSTKLSKARVPCPLNPAIVEALSKRALAGSSLIPPFQQTLLSRSESTTMHREIFLDAPSGSASPQMLQSRSRNDTQSSNYSASNTTLSTMTVTVPVVNSSALHDLRSERKNTRADSTDSASTLPGELLLYDTSFNQEDAVGSGGKYSPVPGSHMSTSLASSRPHAASGAAAPSGRHGSMSSADAFNTSAHAKKAKQAYARYNLPNQVLLTPLVEIPGTRVKRYLGPVLLHFLKDAFSARGLAAGTVGSFYYMMISEAGAVARAHVAALGGNALLCYRLVPQESGGRASRNQPYSLLSVTGDAVLLEFTSPSAAAGDGSVTGGSSVLTTSTSTTAPTNLAAGSSVGLGGQGGFESTSSSQPFAGGSSGGSGMGKQASGDAVFGIL